MGACKSMLTDGIPLVVYTAREEKLNTLTHAAGALLALGALAACLADASAPGRPRDWASALVYGLSLVTMFGASALYHGLPGGRWKKITRVIDYSMIFLLIAGTATPCALIGLYDRSHGTAWFVLAVAWGCAATGILSTVFFFEKTKALRIVLYLGEGVVMFSSVFPILDLIDLRALLLLIAGGLIQVFGLIFLRLGKTVEFAHMVFHLVVIAGCSVHFYVMISYLF